MELTFETVDHICSNALNKKGGYVIDLANVTFFRPFALVYLGMFLRYHNSIGNKCSVILPNNLTAKQYLSRQNFWERFNFHPDVVAREKLNRLTTSTSLNDIVDIERTPAIAEYVEQQVKRVLIRCGVKIKVSEVANTACELVDNFARHSERTLAAFHVQYYPKRNEIAFAIADCGIGIRASLSSNPKYEYLESRPHYEAALTAFEPGVTRQQEGGMGLTEVMETVKMLNGSLFLSTGDEYVKMYLDEVEHGKMAYDLTGVQIEVSFPEE